MGFIENQLEQNMSWRARNQIRGGFRLPREVIDEPVPPFDWSTDPDYAVKQPDGHERSLSSQDMPAGGAIERE